MHLYSDGSSQHQESITIRLAAYSLVLDLVGDDEARNIQASNYMLTRTIPNTLCTIAKARCKGEQNANRAELLIIAIASDAFSAFKLYTDCSTAKSLRVLGT